MVGKWRLIIQQPFRIRQIPNDQQPEQEYPDEKQADKIDEAAEPAAVPIAGEKPLHPPEQAAPFALNAKARGRGITRSGSASGGIRGGGGARVRHFAQASSMKLRRCQPLRSNHCNCAQGYLPHRSLTELRCPPALLAYGAALPPALLATPAGCEPRAICRAKWVSTA